MARTVAAVKTAAGMAGTAIERRNKPRNSHSLHMNCPNPHCAHACPPEAQNCPRCATRLDCLNRFTGRLTRLRLRLEAPFLAVLRLPRWTQRVAHWLTVVLWLYALTELPFMRRGLVGWSSPVDQVIWTLCNPLFWLVLPVAAFLAQLARCRLPLGLCGWLHALPASLQWVAVLGTEAAVLLALTHGRLWSKFVGLITAGYLFVIIFDLARHLAWRLFRRNNYRALTRE